MWKSVAMSSKQCFLFKTSALPSRSVSNKYCLLKKTIRCSLFLFQSTEAIGSSSNWNEYNEILIVSFALDSNQAVSHVAKTVNNHRVQQLEERLMRSRCWVRSVLELHLSLPMIKRALRIETKIKKNYLSGRCGCDSVLFCWPAINRRQQLCLLILINLP